MVQLAKPVSTFKTNRYKIDVDPRVVLRRELVDSGWRVKRIARLAKELFKLVRW